VLYYGSPERKPTKEALAKGIKREDVVPGIKNLSQKKERIIQFNNTKTKKKKQTPSRETASAKGRTKGHGHWRKNKAKKLRQKN